MPKVKFFCVKCGRKNKKKGTKYSSGPFKLKRTKNYRHMLQTKCKDCGITMGRFIKKDEVNKYK